MRKVEWREAREIFLKADREARDQREEAELAAAVEADLRYTQRKGWAVMTLLGFLIVGFLSGLVYVTGEIRDYVTKAIIGE